MILRVCGNIHICEFHLRFRNVDLNISTRFVIHIFWKLHNEFLYVGSYIVIRNYFCLPFLNPKNLFFNMNFHIFFYLNLAAKSVIRCNFLAREVRGFCRQNFSSTFIYLTNTLNTRTTATTSRRKKDSITSECSQ